MKRPYIIYLITTLLVILGCDRIHDTPEPDQFLIFKPKALSFSIPEGHADVVFNVLDSNDLKSEYTLKMGQPAFGTLEKGTTPGQFTYKAPIGFSGKDSVSYEVCRNDVCKQGWISFYILSGQCVLKAKDDTYLVPMRDTLFLTVLENDSICFVNNLSFPSGASIGSIFTSGNKAALILPPFYEGPVQFSYVIGDGQKADTAEVSIDVFTDLSYCDRQFKARNDTLRLLTGFNFITFYPQALIQNDLACKDSIRTSSFAIVPSPPSNTVYELKFQQNRWWFLVKKPQDFTAGTFQYRVCTNSGKCDTATVVIQTP